VSYLNGLQAETVTTPSIVATCLEELPELSKQGVDEEVIRGVCGSVYLGECHGNIPTEGRRSQARRVSSWWRHGKLNPSDRKFGTADRTIVKISSAIQSFFLAATLHPEVVHLAQQQLDEVLGVERLPDFSDMPQLPYISAIVKEVLRWRPPTPLGTFTRNIALFISQARLASGSPHRLTEDDVYKGQFIPAGATIMDNTWYAIYLCRMLLATG